jgi:tetratricopeptide (TPR) repeat protein
MKKIIFITLAAVLASACNRTPGPVQQANANAQTVNRAANAEPMIAHSTEDRGYPTHGNNSADAKPQSPSKWSQGGEAIDTAKFDSEIAKAEKDLKAKPTDEAAKRAAAVAYFNRAVALTDARQYASALGDYRRCIKFDPSNEEAKNWISQITMIYNSLKKDAPEEGKEPAPLPLKKSEEKKPAA